MTIQTFIDATRREYSVGEWGKNGGLHAWFVTAIKGGRAMMLIRGFSSSGMILLERFIRLPKCGFDLPLAYWMEVDGMNRMNWMNWMNRQNRQNQTDELGDEETGDGQS